MRALMQTAMFSAAALGLTLPLSTADDKAKVKIEFRRAETKAADGLTEAAVLGSKEKVYLHKTVELTNADIAEVSAGVDRSLEPCIDLTLTKEGAKKMEKLSGEHREKPLAVLVDGKVWTAPTIRAKIGERVQITGKFTKEEVEKLVKALSAK